ncbi:zinc ribbon domain-containing protein [Streptomyces coeruleofuscus]|uniref:Zinc ribbon domain-containing protein n=1 Tax=Streptomyces coeruleofuscus TaxID=66879 RepID=A0ABN3HWF1_9ACTN
MRACPSCGASNGSTDDFCGNCGAYLGWSDTGPAPSPPSEPADAPDPTPPVSIPPDATPASASLPAADRPTAAEPGRSSSSRTWLTGLSRGGGEAGAANTVGSGPGYDEGLGAAPGQDARPSPPPRADADADADADHAGTEPPAPAQGPTPGVGEGTGTDGTPGGGEGTRTGGTPAGGEGTRTGGTPAGGEGTSTGGTPRDGEITRTDGTPRAGEAPRTAGAPPTTAPVSAAPAGTTGSGPTASGPTASGPVARPPRRPAPPPAPTPAPATRDTPGPRTPARPVPEASAPDPIQPVRPAKPVAPRPVVRPVAEPDEATGTPCPACGTPNPPSRRFCRRCASELNPTAKPAPLPWWRTVWPLRRRVRAGSGRAVRFLVILAVVAALCAGGLLLLPAGRALVEDTRDKLGKPKPVTPVGIEASVEIPRHPATNTTDGLNNRYWAAPAPGASVTYTFRKPFRLVDLIITNGASASAEAYARQARALQLELEVTKQDGKRHHKQLSLSDKPGPQTIPTGISDAKTVRLVLRSPVGLTGGRHLALAEVEFFQRG